MPRIEVSYGPPGQTGVTQILGLGADEVDALQSKTDQALTKAGWLSLGAWALGVVVNKKALRHAGLGGALVAFGVKHLGR
jgi:hypothetical protein